MGTEARIAGVARVDGVTRVVGLAGWPGCWG